MEKRFGIKTNKMYGHGGNILGVSRRKALTTERHKNQPLCLLKVSTLRRRLGEGQEVIGGVCITGIGMTEGSVPGAGSHISKNMGVPVKG